MPKIDVIYYNILPITLPSIYRLTLNEAAGFLKHEPGFAMKAIHAGQKPELWQCK